MEPLVIGHRGFAALAPENTMGAFRMAWEAGADGVECDIHLTADGEIVCIHDDDTSRVAKSRLVIAESNWKALHELDVGSWKSKDWAGESIPKLSELLESAPTGKQVVIEIKCGPEIIGPLVKVVEASPADRRQLRFISFEADSLRALKRVQPDWKAYWLSHFRKGFLGGFKPTIQEISETVDELGVDGFGGESGKGICAELVEALHARSWDLNVWTVDDPNEALRMRALGVTSITTNHPRNIISALRESS